MGLSCALIIPDTHRPFHDKRAYNLMLKVAKDLKPSEIVILGDYCDAYSLSSHSKDPRVFTMITDEVEDTLAGLDELDREFPSAQKVFIQGNHEWRLERYLCNQAPALFGVTDTRFLLKLNQRPKWTFIPYGPNQIHRVLGSKLLARHEPIGRTSEMTARKAMASMVFGHIHRIQMNYSVGIEGKQHVAYCPGWLGDKRKDLIFGYVKTHHDWQLGFSLVFVDDKTKFFYHCIIPILSNYTCVFQGKQYKG